jgi:hypothetical protein
MPTQATLAKRKVVMPPNTGCGMVVITAATLAKMPARMSQKAVAKPAVREAQLVSWMTPLFCAKHTTGMEVASAPRKVEMPSALHAG